MAHRDKSQGFGFVYVDIKELLEASRSSKGAELPLKGQNVFNFNRQPTPRSPLTSPIRKNPYQSGPLKTNPDAAAPKGVDRKEAITQVKRNLDRLQSLHHKLHSILADLNKVADKKKKKD